MKRDLWVGNKKISASPTLIPNLKTEMRKGIGASKIADSPNSAKHPHGYKQSFSPTFLMMIPSAHRRDMIRPNSWKVIFRPGGGNERGGGGQTEPDPPITKHCVCTTPQDWHIVFSITLEVTHPSLQLASVPISFVNHPPRSKSTPWTGASDDWKPAARTFNLENYAISVAVGVMIYGQ